MDPKKATIAGSIALVLIGLVVTGIIVYRQRALAPEETVLVDQSGSPVSPGTQGTTPATTTPPVATPPAEASAVNAPDYTGAPDADNDGLTDSQELANGTDAHKADTDGDSYGDYEELVRGTNPIDKASHPEAHEQQKQP